MAVGWRCYCCWRDFFFIHCNAFVNTVENVLVNILKTKNDIFIGFILSFAFGCVRTSFGSFINSMTMQTIAVFTRMIYIFFQKLITENIYIFIVSDFKKQTHTHTFVIDFFFCRDFIIVTFRPTMSIRR